ncbi:sugar transferase [Intestinibacillus massiliensis]|nr:sugar transferase [Intestinibacillus massiliensis]
MSADTAYIKYVLPEKMKYNLEYMKTFSFWDDVKLMIKTFIKVLT